MTSWVGLAYGLAYRFCIFRVCLNVGKRHLQGIVGIRVSVSLFNLNSIPWPKKIGTIWEPKPTMPMAVCLYAVPCGLPSSPLST